MYYEIKNVCLDLTEYSAWTCELRFDMVYVWHTTSHDALLSGIAHDSREQFDIVHSFGRLAYLLPALPTAVPKLMSYQREITARSISWGNRLSGGSLHFSGCSRHLVEPFSGAHNWHVVYNGVASSAYAFRPRVSEDAPLIFLGRVEEIKGPHLAIEVARRAGRSLVIAGNVPLQAVHQEFFKTRVAPHVDGKQITYVGPVDDVRKNEILGNAAASVVQFIQALF